VTGVASALRTKCTHIATDSACSLSQIWKQLLLPELHTKHTHCKVLEQIVSMINELDTPINFYKVKAHICVIGNEFADAVAKHAALHNYGHDEEFPPPLPDGNPFAHIFWLAEEKNETSHNTTRIRLSPIQNIKDKIKAHMTKHNRLGDANTNYGYCNNWKRLLTSVNHTTSNSFWNNTRINISQKRNAMKFITGTLYTQKMAHLYGRATSSSCLLCQQPDSQIHMLSGCQNASIQTMVTERHHIASRLIIKTLNKSKFEGNMIFTGIGSETRMAQQSLALPAHEANRTLSQWLLPGFSADELQSCSRPDAICILPVKTKNGHQRDIQATQPSRWDVHLIEVKYCDDTRPEQQLEEQLNSKLD